MQVEGKGSRTYTFTEIATGTGLSLPLVSLILRRKRPISAYAEARLREFFGLGPEDPCTINVNTPPVRPVGRAVYRIHRGSTYRPPFRDWRTAMREAAAMDSEPLPPYLRELKNKNEM